LFDVAAARSDRYEAPFGQHDDHACARETIIVHIQLGNLMNRLSLKTSIATALASCLLAGSAVAADRATTAYASTGSAPVITHLICPDANNSGGGIYVCRVRFTSSTPAYIRWPDGSDNEEYIGVCARGQRPTVTVTVTNAAGSTSRTNTFNCPTGPYL
jgi:hypothetical protein